MPHGAQPIHEPPAQLPGLGRLLLLYFVFLSYTFTLALDSKIIDAGPIIQRTCFCMSTMYFNTSERCTTMDS